MISISTTGLTHSPWQALAISLAILITISTAIFVSICSRLISDLSSLATKDYGTGRHVWDVPISWAAPNRLVRARSCLTVTKLSADDV